MFILSPSCFAVCGHHPSPRIAIVFSLLSSVPNFSTSHSSIYLIPSSNTSRSFLRISFTFSHYMSSTLYCIATRAHLCIFFHLLSATGVPFFFLAGPGPLHEITIPAFSRSPLGHANMSSFSSLLLTHRKSLGIPPFSSGFIAVVFPIL